MKYLLALFVLALVIPLQAQTAYYPDIQNNSYGSGWQECDVGCAGGTNPPTFTQFLQNSNEHTLDGKSTKMTVSGPDTDVLWYNKVGVNNSANTVVWDHWVYFDVNSYIWAFEFDMFQFVAHFNYMMGTECSFGGGFWQLYDEANTQWVNTAIPCTRTGFAPNTWHHLVLVGYTNTTSHSYTFINLQIDGTDHPLGVTYNARNMGSGWGDNSGAQYQADTMSSAGTVHMWIDKSNLSLYSATAMNTPPVPVLPVGCATADATCVPQLAGQDPMLTTRYIPVVAALGSFDPSTQCGMPGVSYTYPSTADTRHVWCPLTVASARSLMNLETIGGATLHPGDSIFFQKQSSGTTYSFDGKMYPGHSCETALIFQGFASDCNLAIPGLDNPSKEITYMGTTGFAAMPLSGDRISDADLPNMAKFYLNTNVGGSAGTVDVLPYANYWYIEGIEMTSNSTGGAKYYQAGEQTFLLQVAEGADTGQRDLIATTGGLVEILGQALSVSSEGGVLVGTNKQSCALGATCNLTIIGQDTHMCDNMAVSCASVGADSPTFGTLGYGVKFNNITVTNISCPSSPYTMTASGGCQQAVLNITVSASAIIPAVQASGTSGSAGSAPTRPLILRTPRNGTSHRDEYLINNAALDITDSTIPMIIQVINTTLGNQPVLPLPSVVGTSSAPQTLHIITQNAHMVGKGIGTAQFTLGGGGASSDRINVISANVINDNELDVVITVQHDFNFAEPVWLAILGGGTNGVPVPIISGYAENLVYQIPVAQTNSWIQSIDCPQVVPGETYTCHIVGSPNTNWFVNPPTFSSPANVQPNGSLDLRITFQSIQDAHHATITFTVDGSYPPVPNHITFDHVHVHGIEPGIRKDANGLYTPLPLALQGTVKAQGVGIPVEIEGSMNAFINSRCTGAMWPDGESHCIYSQLGPGPLLFRNNEAEGAQENFFFSGSWPFSQASPQAFPMDFALIQNYSHQLESNNGNAALQRLQPASGTTTVAVNHALANQAFTNFVITLLGGSISGVTGGRSSDGLNTGFLECPDGIFPIGVFTCSVDGTGALQFHVVNAGSGYTTPPPLTLYYSGPMLVKNCAESKGNMRLLWFGNVCENFMPNSGLLQVGGAVALSSKDVGSGSQLAVLQDITVKDNYGLKNFTPVGFFADTFCYQSISRWLYSSKGGCSPAWDYNGAYPNPLTVGGTAAGNPGGYGSNMSWINNLWTTSDIADYNGIGGAGGGLFPNPAIWNPVFHDLQFTPNAMVNVAFVHNTIWKRNGWSSGPETSIMYGSSGLTPNPFTYAIPFSIETNGWFLNNAMMGSPSAGGASSDIGGRVSNMTGCPNSSGPACPLGGAANWPARFSGNFFYNSVLSNTPATGDFTFGALASNVSFPATSVGTSAGQPVFANPGSQIEGVQSGNWQITGPPPGGTLPTTTDSGPVGVDNTELQAAIAHVFNGMFSSSSSVTIIPSSLTFGNQIVGSSSASQAVVLNNNQSGTLAISSIATTGDFAQTNGCGSSLSAHGSCTINVTFTPTVAGTRTGTLSVTDDGPGSPQTAGLTGTGIDSMGNTTLTGVTATGVTIK